MDSVREFTRDVYPSKSTLIESHLRNFIIKNNTAGRKTKCRKYGHILTPTKTKHCLLLFKKVFAFSVLLTTYNTLIDYSPSSYGDLTCKKTNIERIKIAKRFIIFKHF